jgi:hypothetical protein
MIGTESTVIGTAIFDGSIEFERHIPWLNELLALLVILNIIRNQYLLVSVGWAVFN